MPRPISADDLHAHLMEETGEIALIDTREEAAFSERHLLHAISVPLSRLEMLIADLAPRPGTMVVAMDAGEGFASRAAERLEALGYRDVRVLAGGIEAWAEAGHELFSGFNVPSKAFGEFVEHHYGTPSIDADELKAMIDGGERMVVLDSRPMDEFNVMNIPGASCCPGGELVYRLHDIAPDPATTVVVNCAGRTRSIMGAQSLINAGVPNRVIALRNGTMGWHLAGHELERGLSRRFPEVSDEGVEVARTRARAVAERHGVGFIDPARLAAMQAETDRTTFLLDVRDPAEYLAGHLPGSINAPGGQLVQATDRYAGVRGARVVLVDDTGVRATMTAHWLKQMRWEVFVLEGGLTDAALETGPRPRRVPGLIEAETLTPGELSAVLDAQEPVAVVDLAYSRDYRRGHIPGAWFAVRARLDQNMGRMPRMGLYVLTSEDGLLAHLAVPDLRRAVGEDAIIRVLAGGTAAWRAAGFPLAEGEEVMADATDDVWLKPYERRGGTVEDYMKEYLTWEIALIEQIKRDGTVRFDAPAL